jgi:hypothetical protein
LTSKKNCENILAGLAEIERQKDALEQELLLVKPLLNRNDQPYSYLIQTTGEKEVEIRTNKKRMRAKQDNHLIVRIEQEQLHVLRSYNGLQKKNLR